MSYPSHQIHPIAKASAVWLLFCGLAATAGAQTVVLDSYGPDIDYLEGWPTPLVQGQNVAIPFEIASSTRIQSIRTTIDGIGSLTLGVLSRQGGLPGPLDWLHSVQLADPQLNSLLTPSDWSLSAGSYWLVAVPGAGFDGSWQSPTNQASAPWAYTSAPGVWTAVTTSFTGLPGARISVTSAVPEPASAALLMGGGLLLAALAKRKSKE